MSGRPMTYFFLVLLVLALVRVAGALGGRPLPDRVAGFVVEASFISSTGGVFFDLVDRLVFIGAVSSFSTACFFPRPRVRLATEMTELSSSSKSLFCVFLCRVDLRVDEAIESSSVPVSAAFFFDRLPVVETSSSVI